MQTHTHGANKVAPVLPVVVPEPGLGILGDHVRERIALAVEPDKYRRLPANDSRPPLPGGR